MERRRSFEAWGRVGRQDVGEETRGLAGPCLLAGPSQLSYPGDSNVLRLHSAFRRRHGFLASLDEMVTT